MGGMFPRCMMRLDKFKCEYPPSQQEQAGQTWCLILSPAPTKPKMLDADSRAVTSSPYGNLNKFIHPVILPVFSSTCER